MNTFVLNPNGQLLQEFAQALKEARKTKSLWAKRLEVECEVETLEGRLKAQPGDFLCRGIHGEFWPQKEKKVLEKYKATGRLDASGWQRFDPIPDSEPVEATQVDSPFCVIAHWGELKGKCNDYLVRSKTDPTDIWIVDKAIFEATYEFSKTSTSESSSNSI